MKIKIVLWRDYAYYENNYEMPILSIVVFQESHD